MDRGVPAAPGGSRDRPIVIDGLALGVLPEAAASLHSARPVVALVHHPLACSKPASTVTWPSSFEIASDRLSPRPISSSRRATLPPDLLSDRYAVPRDRLRVHPTRHRSGAVLDRHAEAAGFSSSQVGAIVPRKGFDVLVEALARMTDLSWQLTIVGDRGRDPGAAIRN